MGAGRRPGATSRSSVSPRSRAAGLCCCLASSRRRCCRSVGAGQSEALQFLLCFCSAVSPHQFVPSLPPDLTARGSSNHRLLTAFYSASSDALHGVLCFFLCRWKMAVLSYLWPRQNRFLLIQEALLLLLLLIQEALLLQRHAVQLLDAWMTMATGSKTQEIRPSPELPKQLPFDFLKKITNDFSMERMIGGGPFGGVYKGVMPDDGRVIAVKKLQENAPMPPDKTFNNEVQNIMALKHENIVELVGFCWETQKKLVQFDGRYIQADITESLLCYEYLPNGSLQQNIFGTKTTEVVSSAEPAIDWATRFKIIKIADFGLSRVFGHEQTRLYTQTVVGSYGYMAPEYLYRGEISAQSDIYSLGLLILEISTGEQNCKDKNQPSARNFIDKVREDWTLEHIASKYASLDTEGLHQVKTCIELGLKCAEIDRRGRPLIEEIVDTLNGIRANEMANEVPHASPVSKKMGFLGFKKK